LGDPEIEERTRKATSMSRSEIGFGWRHSGIQAFRPSGGVRVLVDEAVEDRSSADLQGVEIGPDGAGSVRFVVRGALGDAWCGRAML
jgi:hypothetical protein